ncbi:poly-gamma-glutamate hydrolase family protein [Halovivax gelatinilyticus]|uniref:poly-gamma-glutamate hydrolase family protein n=1 Tax=Halovivax gelatinilyticus TaxID=2961597 RepID=UPI0020CA62F4|nr:poly-gamma-glutamate hydrolase family protein [Halovivax gelatinilyticus]
MAPRDSSSELSARLSPLPGRRDVLRLGASVTSLSLLFTMRGDRLHRPAAIENSREGPARIGAGASYVGGRDPDGTPSAEAVDSTVGGTPDESETDDSKPETDSAFDDGGEDETGDGGDDDNGDADDGGGDGEDADDDSGEDDSGGNGGDEEDDDGDEDDDSPEWKDGVVTLTETPLEAVGSIGADCHCLLANDFLDHHDLVVGQQIRIAPASSGGAVDAIFTVSGGHDGEPGELAIDPEGLDVLVADDGDRASIGHLAVDASIETRDEARAQDEYAEYLVGTQSQPDLVVLAPHGGHIERGTDRQAERLADALDGLGWICVGFDEPGVAFDRYHVTSTAIHERSFPTLESIYDTQYEWGVAFHGYSTDDRILVGGRCDDDVRLAVRDAIAEAAPDLDVELAESDSPYAGVSPQNILNRLSPFDNTIQLEQPLSVRLERSDAVVDAIAGVIEGKLGGEEATIERPVG